MGYPADDALRAAVTTNLAGFDAVALDRAGRRHSAVALCIVRGDGDEAALVITTRAAGLRAHARQYALPGGRVDDGETAVGAALREMHEEVGVQCNESAVLGVLDDYATRSGYVITPVVVWGPTALEVVPNPDEVEEVHIVPIADLEHPDAPRLLTIPESDQPVIQMPMRGGWIHAPTAAVLYQFREVCIHARPTRVAHFEQPTWAWK
jgi:8-oxo-dGTP pyrophosphatase MutT (NUDIX family)